MGLVTVLDNDESETVMEPNVLYQVVGFCAEIDASNSYKKNNNKNNNNNNNNNNINNCRFCKNGTCTRHNNNNNGNKNNNNLNNIRNVVISHRHKINKAIVSAKNAANAANAAKEAAEKKL